MIKIEYAFELGQSVMIKELEWRGVVTALWTSRRGNEIQVRYFMGGKAEEVYFFEHELEEIKNGKDNLS